MRTSSPSGAAGARPSNQYQQRPRAKNHAAPDQFRAGARAGATRCTVSRSLDDSLSPAPLLGPWPRRGTARL
eukprot:783586-Prymnesium_polylepis.1